MVGKISPKLGVEVYVGENFDICLKQYDHSIGEQVIVLHPSEAEGLIELLRAGIKQSAELRAEDEENS